MAISVQPLYNDDASVPPLGAIVSDADLDRLSGKKTGQATRPHI